MEEKEKEIKCVIWDLDNTIWNGILLEADDVKLVEGLVQILQCLDSRGILNSISSKNNHDDAIKKLQEFNIAEYFIYPEINWNAKSVSVGKIRENLNIGMDTIAFIDDQDFERDEVKSVHPEIRCFRADQYLALLELKPFNPRFITEDSKNRRKMYLDDMTRNNLESEFKGTPEAFLANLDLEFTISEAQESDLKRAEELTIRTHQLNATGITYSYEELNFFRTSDQHKLFVCELTDKYGSYGKIGISLIEDNGEEWCLKLLLMSCRVMSRGVGSVLLLYIMNQAKILKRRFLADFKRTDRNKVMYVTYKFNNFREIKTDNEGNLVFENDLTMIQDYPSYIKLNFPDTVYVEKERNELR